MARIRVWDLPTRLFHWSLVAAVVASFVTEQAGNLDAHARAGLTVLGLLVFRVSWGFLGSTHARFRQFVRGPGAIRAYLQGQWQGVGHNPLGALSVVAMLGVLLLQAATGLVANDDSTFTGPLNALVSGELSDLATRVHHLQVPVIIGLVLLHVSAILFYVRVKKQNLLRPMITGITDADPAQAAEGGGLLSLVVSLALAAGAVYLASGGWMLPPPPPEALPPTPAW